MAAAAKEELVAFLTAINSDESRDVIKGLKAFAAAGRLEVERLTGMVDGQVAEGVQTVDANPMSFDAWLNSPRIRYLIASPKCAELMGLWELPKAEANATISREAQRTVPAVLNCLAVILQSVSSCEVFGMANCPDDLMNARNNARAVAKVVLRDRTKLLSTYTSTDGSNSKDQNMVKGALRVLAAIASQGAASTREVHTRFNISHPSFLKLMHRGIRKRTKDDKDSSEVTTTTAAIENEDEKKQTEEEQKHDDSSNGSIDEQVVLLDDEAVARLRAPETIRKLFVDVIMTMLVYGDINVKKSLLEVKGLVGPLFKGLIDDPARMAGPMLTNLCKSVLEDRAVGRRAKLSLFNQTVVGYLLECYRSENEVLCAVVHDFNKRLFVDLQSSPFGLTVTVGGDKHLAVSNDLDATAVEEGTTTVTLAPGARRAVVHTVCALRPGDDELQLELLIGILRLYPSLTQVYFGQAVQANLEPRPSPRFYESASAIGQVLQVPIEVSEVKYLSKLLPHDDIGTGSGLHLLAGGAHQQPDVSSDEVMTELRAIAASHHVLASAPTQTLSGGGRGDDTDLDMEANETITEQTTLESVVAGAVAAILPRSSTLSKVALSKGVQHPDSQVAITCLGLVNQLLSRCSWLLDELMKQAITSGGAGTNGKRALQTCLARAVERRVPDVNVIMARWSKVSKLSSMSSKVSKMDENEEMDQTMKANFLVRLQQQRCLEAFYWYARVLPEVLTTVVDPTRFLPRGGSLLTSPLITSSEAEGGHSLWSVESVLAAIKVVEAVDTGKLSWLHTSKIVYEENCDQDDNKAQTLSMSNLAVLVELRQRVASKVLDSIDEEDNNSLGQLKKQCDRLTLAALHATGLFDSVNSNDCFVLSNVDDILNDDARNSNANVVSLESAIWMNAIRSHGDVTLFDKIISTATNPNLATHGAINISTTTNSSTISVLLDTFFAVARPDDMSHVAFLQRVITDLLVGLSYPFQVVSIIQDHREAYPLLEGLVSISPLHIDMGSESEKADAMDVDVVPCFVRGVAVKEMKSLEEMLRTRPDITDVLKAYKDLNASVVHEYLELVLWGIQEDGNKLSLDTFPSACLESLSFTTLLSYCISCPSTSTVSRLFAPNIIVDSSSTSSSVIQLLENKAPATNSAEGIMTTNFIAHVLCSFVNKDSSGCKDSKAIEADIRLLFALLKLCWKSASLWSGKDAAINALLARAPLRTILTSPPSEPLANVYQEELVSCIKVADDFCLNSNEINSVLKCTSKHVTELFESLVLPPFTNANIEDKAKSSGLATAGMLITSLCQLTGYLTSNDRLHFVESVALLTDELLTSAYAASSEAGMTASWDKLPLVVRQHVEAMCVLVSECLSTNTTATNNKSDKLASSNNETVTDWSRSLLVVIVNLCGEPVIGSVLGSALATLIGESVTNKTVTDDVILESALLTSRVVSTGETKKSLASSSARKRRRGGNGSIEQAGTSETNNKNNNTLFTMLWRDAMVGRISAHWGTMASLMTSSASPHALHFVGCLCRDVAFQNDVSVVADEGATGNNLVGMLQILAAFTHSTSPLAVYLCEAAPVQILIGENKNRKSKKHTTLTDMFGYAVSILCTNALESLYSLGLEQRAHAERVLQVFFSVSRKATVMGIDGMKELMNAYVVERSVTNTCTSALVLASTLVFGDKKLTSSGDGPVLEWLCALLVRAVGIMASEVVVLTTSDKQAAAGPSPLFSQALAVLEQALTSHLTRNNWDVCKSQEIGGSGLQDALKKYVRVTVARKQSRVAVPWVLKGLQTVLLCAARFELFEAKGGVFVPASVQDFVVSHPLFLSALAPGTANDDEEDDEAEKRQARRIQTREGLMRVLLTLTELDTPGCAREPLLPLLLSLYSASMSHSDRVIRRLLHLYESVNLSPMLAGFAYGEAVSPDVLRAKVRGGAGLGVINSEKEEEGKKTESELNITSLVNFAQERFAWLFEFGLRNDQVLRSIDHFARLRGMHPGALMSCVVAQPLCIETENNTKLGGDVLVLELSDNDDDESDDDEVDALLSDAEDDDENMELMDGALIESEQVEDDDEEDNDDDLVEAAAGSTQNNNQKKNKKKSTSANDEEGDEGDTDTEEEEEENVEDATEDDRDESIQLLDSALLSRVYDPSYVLAALNQFVQLYALAVLDPPTDKTEEAKVVSEGAEAEDDLDAQRTVLAATFPARRLIQCGAVSFAIASLSSSRVHVRKGASSFLQIFGQLTVRTTSFRERSQVVVLLRSLRDGLTRSFMSVPPLVCKFAHEALMVVLKPSHAMYGLVNAFLLQRPWVDHSDVPMFYATFNSGTANHVVERAWMLRLLARGTQSDKDVSVVLRRHVASATMSLLSSSLCDTTAHTWALRFLDRLARGCRHGAQAFARAGGFAWCLIEMNRQVLEIERLESEKEGAYMGGEGGRDHERHTKWIHHTSQVATLVSMITGALERLSMTSSSTSSLRQHDVNTSATAAASYEVSSLAPAVASLVAKVISASKVVDGSKQNVHSGMGIADKQDVDTDVVGVLLGLVALSIKCSTACSRKSASTKSNGVSKVSLCISDLGTFVRVIKHAHALNVDLDDEQFWKVAQSDLISSLRTFGCTDSFESPLLSKSNGSIGASRTADALVKLISMADVGSVAMGDNEQDWCDMFTVSLAACSNEQHEDEQVATAVASVLVDMVSNVQGLQAVLRSALVVKKNENDQDLLRSARRAVQRPASARVLTLIAPMLQSLLNSSEVLCESPVSLTEAWASERVVVDLRGQLQSLGGEVESSAGGKRKRGDTENASAEVAYVAALEKAGELWSEELNVKL